MHAKSGDFVKRVYHIGTDLVNRHG